MLRRLSKRFSTSSKKDIQNGYNKEQSNGTGPQSPAAVTGRISESSSDAENSKEGPASRDDVKGTFEQFAQLIHAAQRPLPNQTGDGAYLEKEEPTGFWQDIKSLGYKDLKTVKAILEDKASGKPQDDKTMHMEQLMQVRFN